MSSHKRKSNASIHDDSPKRFKLEPRQANRKEQWSFSSPQPVTEVARGRKKIIEFIVHKSLICHQSPFFDAAFNGSFIEAGTQIMTLDDVEAPVFGLLVNWLYTKKIEDSNGNTPDVVSLAKLWTLAEKCLMPKLQNAAIDIILDIFQSLNRRELLGFIRHAYDPSGPERVDGSLRVLAAEAFLWLSTASLMKWLEYPYVGELPPDLLKRIILLLKKYIPTPYSVKFITKESLHVPVEME